MADYPPSKDSQIRDTYWGGEESPVSAISCGRPESLYAWQRRYNIVSVVDSLRAIKSPPESPFSSDDEDTGVVAVKDESAARSHVFLRGSNTDPVPSYVHFDGKELEVLSDERAARALSIEMAHQLVPPLRSILQERPDYDSGSDDVKDSLASRFHTLLGIFVENVERVYMKLLPRKDLSHAATILDHLGKTSGGKGKFTREQRETANRQAKSIVKYRVGAGKDESYHIDSVSETPILNLPSIRAMYDEQKIESEGWDSYQIWTKNLPFALSFLLEDSMRADEKARKLSEGDATQKAPPLSAEDRTRVLLSAKRYMLERLPEVTQESSADFVKRRRAFEADLNLCAQSDDTKMLKTLLNIKLSRQLRVDEEGGLLPPNFLLNGATEDKMISVPEGEIDLIHADDKFDVVPQV